MTLALLRTPAVYPVAPAPVRRTLLDVLAETVAEHPDEAAIDAGGTVLTYRGLADEVDAVRRRLAERGIGVGDRVGVRISSGTAELYVAILAVLAAGAAYVPVDADDPDERAELVFGEAGVCAVLGDGGPLTIARRAARRAGRARARRRRVDHLHLRLDRHARRASRSATAPRRRSSTPRPRLFLADEPIGPGDRVLAGLSVAFDASCEEMWLAWRHGACLVPGAPVAGAHRRRPRAVAGRAAASPSCPPCRRSPRCGRPRRSTTSGC